MTNTKRDQMAKESACIYFGEYHSWPGPSSTYEHGFCNGWDACESEKRAYMHLQTTKEMIEWQAMAERLAEALDKAIQTINYWQEFEDTTKMDRWLPEVRKALAEFEVVKGKNEPLT